MIKKKLFSYIIIILLLVMSTLENYLDFSLVFDLEVSTSQLLYNIMIAALFGVFLDLILYGISKIKIGGHEAKVLFQIISYFLVSMWFIIWALHMNMSLLVLGNMEPSMQFVQGFYRHILLSQFYAVIAVTLMKSISIPIHIKDLKNGI